MSKYIVIFLGDRNILVLLATGVVKLTFQMHKSKIFFNNLYEGVEQ